MGQRALHARVRLLGLAWASVGAACRDPLPPYAQTEIRVDTDAPEVISRLRVDVWSAQGSWLDSRTFSVRNRADWPVSFVVFRETEAEGAAFVRLRGFRDGDERDYRGERHVIVDPQASDDRVVGWSPATEEPRLIKDGSDRTPRTEPLPALSIDRLVELPLRSPGATDVRVRLSVACLGKNANLERREGCIDGSRPRAPASDLAWPLPEAPGVGAAPAPRPMSRTEAGPLHDEEAIVPGGLFVLGSRALADSDTRSLPSFPERWARMTTFVIDRHEVTVRRFRDALARGFRPSAMPVTNDGPLARTWRAPAQQNCTFSSVPLAGADERESFPLTCIRHRVAREFCQFFGGDLPSEAAWEYVATTAGKQAKTPFPWGTASLSCRDTVVGRSDAAFGNGACWIADGAYGPLPVTHGVADVTPLGVYGLFGNVAEWVRDAAYDYASFAWYREPLQNPQCAREEVNNPTAAYVVRGQSWLSDPLGATSCARAAWSMDAVAPNVGFRCVREGTP